MFWLILLYIFSFILPGLLAFNSNNNFVKIRIFFLGQRHSGPPWPGHIRQGHQSTTRTGKLNNSEFSTIPKLWKKLTMLCYCTLLLICIEFLRRYFVIIALITSRKYCLRVLRYLINIFLIRWIIIVKLGEKLVWGRKYTVLIVHSSIYSGALTFVFMQALFPAPPFFDFNGRERERVRDHDRPPVYRQVKQDGSLHVILGLNTTRLLSKDAKLRRGHSIVTNE